MINKFLICKIKPDELFFIPDKIMPVVRMDVINENCLWGLWRITETADALQEQLNTNVYDAAHVETITHPAKITEALAVRLLAQHILSYWQASYKGVCKDIHDKPYLVNSTYQISLSHTHQYAAVIINRYQKVGIDIEFVKEKLAKVASKFLSVKELTDAGSRLEKLCIYWCAKEALYKKNGLKQLSFKEHIFINPFLLAQEGTLTGHIMKDGDEEIAKVSYLSVSDLTIAYSFG